MVLHFPWAHGRREQKLRLSPGLLVSHPAHEDLFSCCQRKNFKGAPYSFFAIHITAALVLFMTDGMTVSLPSGCALHPETGIGGWQEKEALRFPRELVCSSVDPKLSTKSSGGDCFQNCSQPLGPVGFCPGQLFTCLLTL